MKDLRDSKQSATWKNDSKFHSKDSIYSTIRDTQASCNVVLETLNDLLAYEKLEAGLMQLEKESVPVYSFVRDVCRPFRMQVMANTFCFTILHTCPS